MKEIEIKDIQECYLLFLKGHKFLAKRIQWFQKLRFGKNSFWYLNHVGFFLKDKDNNLMVLEQDDPGRFQASMFNEEYLKEKADIYIGIPKFEIDEATLKNIRYEAEKLAGADSLLNYSYKSFISFMADSFYKKLFNRECWLTNEPKGSTCSQITVKFYQRHFSVFEEKEWFKWYPCEIAMNNKIELVKLKY